MNQLDVLNIFIAVKTYPGADDKSDHVPLVDSAKLKLKKIIKKSVPTNVTSQI